MRRCWTTKHSVFLVLFIGVVFSLNQCALLIGDAETGDVGPRVLALAAAASGPGGTGSASDSSGTSGGDVNSPDVTAPVPSSGSFTGPAAHAVYANDIVTSDGATGLVWTSCAAGQSGTACTGIASSPDWSAADNYCRGLRTVNGGAGYAARTDWRLPSVKELSTLIVYTSDSPAANATHFPNTVPILSYWTADIYPSATGFAFGIGFKYGTVAANNRGGGLPTRCVSGTAPAAPVFVHGGDGTVTEAASRLMWTRCTLNGSYVPGNGTGFDCVATPGFMTWATALTACDNLSFAGHGDWRLPSIIELKTLTNESTHSPAAYTTAFPNIPPSALYWSATTFHAAPITAWTADARYGQVNANTKTNANQVRCVRSY